jgi:putative N6-adenine-specific DNA methylase
LTETDLPPLQGAASQPRRPDLTLFASTAPGLERICAQELAGLQLEGRVIEGGVAFRGDAADMYRANLHLRTASRILVRLGDFYAGAFSELHKKASRLPWEKSLQRGQPVTVRATCHKSKLYHSDAVAERVASAISDRLGQRVPVQASSEDDEAPGPQLVLVRIVQDRCTISLDSSGALLHQRGYRLATARAPLRETLAAGMLLAARWEPAAPLLDPFCGSGSIAIEAALMGLKRAPGRMRRFAFMDWPDFDLESWQSVVEAADRQAADHSPLILASDRDAGAVEAALANAERAGVAAHVQISQRAVSAIEVPPQRGWVVTNPPFGVRVQGGGDLRNLYAQFGQVLRERCPGWQVAMLSADDTLAASTGLRFDKGRSLRLVSGGLAVTVEQARVQPASD